MFGMNRLIALFCFYGCLVMGCASQPQDTSPPQQGTTTEPGTGTAEPGTGEPGTGTTEPGTTTPGQSAKACVPGGCSNSLCLEEGNDVMSACLYEPEFDCYKTAICKRQPSGECGWSQTPELQACINQARAGQAQ